MMIDILGKPHMMRVMLLGLLLPLASAIAAPPHVVTIDGIFDDWEQLPAYNDPMNDQHDTDHDQEDDVPVHVDHPDVDLLQFKLTHDEQNLYGYFRSRGIIGNTQHESQGRAGRYYVIMTIDVDNDDVTGYPLHEGGYYPTSPGYDMNAEVEFYNGAFNTGHYLNHGCLNEEEYYAAQEDQAMEIVDVRPGTYDWYTQWVMFLQPQGLSGEIVLPSGRSIVWVSDRGPAYPGGILTIALSEDGHEAEIKAPFIGFMRYPNGDPIMATGRTIDVSFSLEASPELSGQGNWGSDTAEPLNGYVLEPRLHSADLDGDRRLSLSEVMRLVQFFNLGAYHCDDSEEDGYAPGLGHHNCLPHESDYWPQDWSISLSELLRAIQIFNLGGYHPCEGGEDGYCPGA